MSPTPFRCSFVRRHLAAVGVALLVTSITDAQTIVEPGWSLIRTIPFTNPIAARINPLDGRIYVGRRDTSTDGLYRIDAQDFATLLAQGTLPAGICIDPTTGAIFQSENNAGIIFRTALGATGRTTWVSGFHSGDDDPAGMAIAPLNYRGRVIAPGSALVVDHGFNGPDEIWRWSPAAAEGESALHADNGTLIDAFDIAIGTNSIYAMDTGARADGTIYVVGVGGALTPLVTSQPLAEPLGIAIDPRGEDLLVAEATTGRVLRVNPTSGSVQEVITGVAFGTNWGSLDATSDGVQLVVTAAGAQTIFVFARCDATEHPNLDCNGNGVVDTCDIALRTASDCNANGVPDSCDIASGRSVDCNGDGVPDECPQCPPVEIVFIMDTSSSMDDEAAALCAALPQISAALTAAGLEVTTEILGICDQPGGAYSCLEDDVANLLGTAVPGNPPAAVATLGACPGGNEVCQEDWALAAAVVAGNYPWLPKGKSVRLVVPISDEGSWCGNPVTATDDLAIDQASAVAVANGVFVSPIVGTGASAVVTALAQELAAATGGLAFSSSKPAADISDSIVELVLSACKLVPKCAIGDLNCDGTVNGADLGILLGSWGGIATPADIDCNGIVDAADLGILLGSWEL